MTTVLKSEGTDPRYRWRHYMIVTDETMVVVDMVPAIMGWNVRSITTQGKGTEQGEDAWPNMSEQAIVAWKIKNHDVVVVDGDEATNVLAMVERKRAAA